MDLSQVDLSKLSKKDLALLIKALGNVDDDKPNTDKSEIIVVSCIMGEIALSINKGRDIIFREYGSKQIFNFNDMNIIVSKSQYQELFQKGFLYFENEEWYDRFHLSKPKMLMTYENVKDIAEKNDGKQLIDKLDELSVRKHNVNFMHYFPMMVAKLVRFDDYNPSYEKRIVINDYFNIKLETIVGLVEFYNKEIV